MLHLMNYTFEEFPWNGQLIDLEIEFTYTPIPYTPGSMYAKNGDPGDPPEGGYAEDVFGKIVDVTFYDKEGDIMSLAPPTKEELQNIQKAFDDYFDDNKKFQDKINDLCMADTEARCDPGDCGDDYYSDLI